MFSQPIGDDAIYSFNAGEDQIDLIGYAGFTGFDDVKNHLTTDATGNAVITLGDGQSITLYGVGAPSLRRQRLRVRSDAGHEQCRHMTISDGALLPLSGIIDNTGTIALELDRKRDELELIQHGITLQGRGQVTLSDSGENFLSSGLPASRSPTWTTRSLAPAISATGG